ncbi:MAG TPA: SDR family NAD(P)-dependent oxidoreductase [Gammaproteobacteria bacterium]|nr:SDR family NAD(P)-dependent oxidoreductase [Gammaproteobacteria bacterium]
MSFTDKTLLITGASDGIGRATALECARAGATVIIHGRTVPKLEKLYDEIVEAGYPQPAIYPLDFEKISPKDCDTLKETIASEFGKLDGLYNNAGWLGASSPIQQYDVELWHRVIQINLNATFMLTQACLPLLNHDDNSSILFTIDDKSSAYWGAYGVSKAGVTSFMHILADELENTRINVTGLNPGKVKTVLRTRAYPAEDTSGLKQPQDVAKAAALLLSDDGREINGEKSYGRIFQLDELL